MWRPTVIANGGGGCSHAAQTSQGLAAPPQPSCYRSRADVASVPVRGGEPGARLWRGGGGAHNPHCRFFITACMHA